MELPNSVHVTIGSRALIGNENIIYIALNLEVARQ